MLNKKSGLFEFNFIMEHNCTQLCVEATCYVKHPEPANRDSDLDCLGYLLVDSYELYEEQNKELLDVSKFDELELAELDKVITGKIYEEARLYLRLLEIEDCYINEESSF